MRDWFALLLLVASVPAYAASALSEDIVFQQQIAGPATSFPRAFPPHVVESWNSYVHEGIVKSFHNHGADIEPGAAIVSTTVVSFGDHEVLKSREEIPSKLFVYQYAGVVGLDVVLVLCSSRTARPFEPIGTDCEKQAAKVFESGPAVSAKWKKLGTNAKGITQYFDGASLRKDGALRYYSLKYELPTPDEHGVAYSVMDEVIDCQQQTITTLKVVGYLAGGSIAARYSGQEPPRPIAPGSNGSEIASALCSK